MIKRYPVIGIRPAIDGRRGPMKLRESLEDQTMALANVSLGFVFKWENKQT